MRIVAFNGSPHGERGTTNAMVTEFLAGAEEAGAEVENILLATKGIEHCRGCFACWIATPGSCIIKDDMADLLGKFNAADVVVFATPLYTDIVTGLMKTFMDRLIPLLDPHVIQDAEGESRHPLRYGKAPRTVVISNCGFPEQSHFQVLSLLFSRFAQNLHSEVIAEIYRGGGPLLVNEAPELQPLITSYFTVLGKAGREVVENLRLSEETKAALEQPLIPPAAYRQGSNLMVDERLSKLNARPG